LTHPLLEVSQLFVFLGGGAIDREVILEDEEEGRKGKERKMEAADPWRKG
jgi:hypothetical protein